MKWLTLLTLLGLVACGPDETVSAYGKGGNYVLIEMDGATVAAQITLNISDSGQISGQGPCNSYAAEQTAPYPWFALGPILSTKRACPDLALEGAYFDALSRMTISEVAGDFLILSNDAKEELTFQSP